VTDVPLLGTHRLVLRSFEASDVETYARICADPETMRHIGDGRVLDLVGAWRAVALMLGHWQLRGYGIWAVEERATGELVGRVGLHRPEGWPGLEVGWLLARSRWGRGYATEAAAAAVDHAWHGLGAEHLISLIDPANDRSIRVAERLGERLEGELELSGRRTLVYGLTRPPSSEPGPGATGMHGAAAASF
jgi:RimJ/RimL family protein N-acetyltransferase